MPLIALGAGAVGAAALIAPALISRPLDGERVERQGRVIRLLSDVAPEGRMARVLVAIDDPLGAIESAPPDSRP